MIIAKSWSNIWYSIKVCKIINKLDVLINIVGSNFSRLKNSSYSWIPKGKEQKIKSIAFRNSCSLVTSIISIGSVIAAKSIDSVHSNMLVEFVNEVLKLIWEANNIKPQNYLVILDNAFIHRSSITEEILKTDGFKEIFIPSILLKWCLLSANSQSSRKL